MSPFFHQSSTAKDSTPNDSLNESLQELEQQQYQQQQQQHQQYQLQQQQFQQQQVVQVVNKEQQPEESGISQQPQPVFELDRSPASKNDLKIPSFISVLPEERQKTESSSIVNPEEIDLLPSASSTSAATPSQEAAPEVPPHREGSSTSASASASVSGEVEKKTKNGKPRSRNRHKR